MTTLNWTEANDLIGRARRVLVLTHVNPDGDAIGSLLGLAHALRRLGKEVTAAVEAACRITCALCRARKASCPR